MKKNCLQCSESFNVSKQDMSFYDSISPVISGEKFSIPPPKICPDCRQQRRLSFRNVNNLYRRKCNLTGKQIISMHHKNTPFPV